MAAADLYGGSVPRRSYPSREGVHHLPHILRVDELEGAPADDVLRRIPEHPLTRRALVAEDPFGGQDADEVRGVIAERVEIFFASTQPLLGRLTGDHVTVNDHAGDGDKQQG